MIAGASARLGFVRRLPRSAQTVALAMLLTLFSFGAGADTVTVEGQRNRADLQRKVNTFLSSVIVHHHDWSFARWDQAVCPLVASLSHDEGEFMLTRLSAIVRAAGAP